MCTNVFAVLDGFVQNAMWNQGHKEHAERAVNVKHGCASNVLYTNQFLHFAMAHSSVQNVIPTIPMKNLHQNQNNTKKSSTIMHLLSLFCSGIKQRLC
jgi:hypothetical protein